jgi:hypothetical protein
MGLAGMSCTGQVSMLNRRQVLQEMMHPVGLCGREEKCEEGNDSHGA